MYLQGKQLYVLPPFSVGVNSKRKNLSKFIPFRPDPMSKSHIIQCGKQTFMQVTKNYFRKRDRGAFIRAEASLRIKMVLYTVKILKLGTPKIITIIIVLQLEQLDFTVQYCFQKMQTE